MLCATRAVLLPWVTGSEAERGVRLVRTVRCPLLDWFFVNAGVVLGNSPQYALALPAICWIGGAPAAAQFLWPLFTACYLNNAIKEVLRLPRPNPELSLETEYLEEYGFPSTHSACAVVWSSGLLYTLTPFFGSTAATVMSSMYCLLVLVSRLYLGVHSLVDLAGGVAVGWFSLQIGASLALRYNAWSSLALYTVLVCGACYIYPDPREKLTSYRDVLIVGGILVGAHVGCALHATTLVWATVGAGATVMSVLVSNASKDRPNSARCFDRWIAHVFVGIAVVALCSVLPHPDSLTFTRNLRLKLA